MNFRKHPALHLMSKSKEIIMIRKLILACAAFAALGATTFTPSDASAREWRSVGPMYGGGYGYYGNRNWAAPRFGFAQC